MSSASSSSRSPSPEPSSPARKRKRAPPPANLDDDSDSDANDSDAEPAPDIPALSHAERRRQKKKEKQQAKDNEESASKKRKLKDGTAVAVSGTGKRQNSVWVGNMSFKTTPENLRTFFEGVGEITRIHMPTKAPAGPGMKGENRGFAYVDFETPEAKIAAIARSENPLIGRKLLIKDGDDFTGRPAPLGAVDGAAAEASSKTHSKTAQKILRVQKQPPAPTLFFGNLGFETTEQSIRELLAAHRIVKKPAKVKVVEVEGGSSDDDENQDNEKEKEKKVQEKKMQDVWIRKVRMGTFEDSGLCKGFAFVDFTTTEHATDALINPRNHTLNGRKLVVEYASADAVRRGAPKPKREEGAAAPPRREFKSRGGRPDRPPRRDFTQSREKRHENPPHRVEGADEEVQERPWYQQRTGAEDGGHGGGEVKGRSAGGHAGGEKTKGPRVRPKPGAALALAKRESAAILPSQGQKITF